MVNIPVNQFRLPESRRATNIFVDLCGSTSIAETLKNNQYLFSLLDRWQRMVAYILCNYGGIIGSSDSDMLMGYFEGEEIETFASSRAILAAKRIRDETIRLGNECHLPLDVHIGIHCGIVEVGIIGPEIRQNLTTIGPSVNIAARLEGKANKGQILLSEQIMKEAKVLWEGIYSGEYLLKGVTELKKCYQVQSVGFLSAPKVQLIESEWIYATLEAQALELSGNDTESFELAKLAAQSPDALVNLNPKFILLPQELCIRTLLGLNRSSEAVRFIQQFSEFAKEFSAQLECAYANFYLAMNLLIQKKYKEAIAAFKNARQIFEQCGNKRKVADSLYYTGVCFQQMNDPKEANRLFKEAENIYLEFITFQNANDVDIGKACLELSLLLTNNPQRVIDILAIAQKKFKDTHQYRYLCRALNNMSFVFCNTLRPSHAENYARRALDLAKDFDPIDGAIVAFGNIGTALETKCNLKMTNRSDSIREILTEAKYNYQQAFDLASKVKIDSACTKMKQYIQRIDQRLQNLES